MEGNLHRFVTFFELYELLANLELKMSQLSLMDDKNEGLGEVFKFQESIEFGWYVREHSNFVKYHENIKGYLYISSWTSEPDLIAMWLLYSQNKNSIRISTTNNKLEECLENYRKKIIGECT